MKQKTQILGLLLSIIVIVSACINPVYAEPIDTSDSSMINTHTMKDPAMPVSSYVSSTVPVVTTLPVPQDVALEPQFPLPEASLFVTSFPHVNHCRVIEKTAATCTSVGVLNYVCQDCDEVILTLETAQEPHSFKRIQTDNCFFRICENCYRLEIGTVITASNIQNNGVAISEWTLFSTSNEKLALNIYSEMKKVGIDPLHDKETVYQIVWDYLYEQIGNAYGVAGLMGNLYAESGITSTNLQNAYEKKYGYGDLTYTYAVDNGAYENFGKDSAGYGIAQWTYKTRKAKLLEFAKEKGTSVGNLQTQLEFLMMELEEKFPSVLRTLKNATSIQQASDAVLLDFEAPKNQSWSVKQARAAYGKDFYDTFAK